MTLKSSVLASFTDPSNRSFFERKQAGGRWKPPRLQEHAAGMKVLSVNMQTYNLTSAKDACDAVGGLDINCIFAYVELPCYNGATLRSAFLTAI